MPTLTSGRKRVEVQFFHRDLLTDRFVPTDAIKTQVVAIADDDIQVTETQFDLALVGMYNYLLNV